MSPFRSGPFTAVGGPAQPALLREMNERAIYGMIREMRPISRAELARRSGLSKPTVSLALRTLVDSGMVVDVGMDSGKPGRAGVLFDPVADLCTAAAVTIEPGMVRCRMHDLDAVEIGAVDHPVEELDRRALATLIIEVVDRAVAASGTERDRLAAIAVSLCAIVDPTTGVVTWPDDADGSGVALADEIRDLSGVVAIVANTIHMAALGEYNSLADGGTRHLVLVASGPQRGTATILDGTLVEGARGGAGLRFAPAPSSRHEDADLGALVDAALLVEPELIVVSRLGEGPDGQALDPGLLVELERRAGEVPVRASNLGADAVTAGVVRLAVDEALMVAFETRLERIARDAPPVARARPALTTAR